MQDAKRNAWHLVTYGLLTALSLPYRQLVIWTSYTEDSLGSSCTLWVAQKFDVSTMFDSNDTVILRIESEW